MPDAQRDLAAEYALGVLTGDELVHARELARADAAFRAQVARWLGRLAPMLDEVDPVPPPAAARAAIEQRLGGKSDDSNVIELRRRVNRWRGIAAAVSAIAACFAIVLVTGVPRAGPAPVHLQQSTAAPLVAMLGSQQQTKVVASWDPAARQLILAVPGAMRSDPLHSHELWVIPSGGKPRSLGAIGEAKLMHRELAGTVAQFLQPGATIAISVEPRGGSPTGAPTGPVIASGALNRA